MIENVSREELSAMLAHGRLRNVMQAIEYEDNRPKEKPRTKGRR